MKLPHRRHFLHLAAGAAGLATVSRGARAQTYPTKPVRIVVGVPAGGPIDISARLIGQWLSERLGQPFIIDNRPGAGGNIGTEPVVRAPADGYTLLLAYASSAINATLFDKLNYDFIRDIAPVASINRIPLVLEVYPSFPGGRPSRRVHRTLRDESEYDSGANAIDRASFPSPACGGGSGRGPRRGDRRRRASGGGNASSASQYKSELRPGCKPGAAFHQQWVGASRWSTQDEVVSMVWVSVARH